MGSSSSPEPATRRRGSSRAATDGRSGTTAGGGMSASAKEAHGLLVEMLELAKLKRGAAGAAGTYLDPLLDELAHLLAGRPFHDANAERSWEVYRRISHELTELAAKGGSATSGAEPTPFAKAMAERAITLE